MFLDDSSWCFLNDISKLAYNTSSFSFVVNVDGITNFSEEDTSPFAYSMLADTVEEESQEHVLDVHDEILQACLKRTVAPRAAQFPTYRASGSRTNSSKPKAKNRARKEVTQLEQRQYRHQFLEAEMREHKSWVDNDVYDLVDMSKYPPKNFVKGRWFLP